MMRRLHSFRPCAIEDPPNPKYIWLAELHRIEDEVPHCRLPPTGAEACFESARDVSRQQGAQMFALRAAMSLAQLWRQQSKSAEARSLLAPAYDWFTEGFATADLKAAQALFATLSA